MSKLPISGAWWLAIAGSLVMSFPKAACAGTPITMNSSTLDQLAQQYKDEGLPLPPPDAPLMLVPAGSYTQDANGNSIPYYLIGYRLKPGASKVRPGTFLIGTEIYEPKLDPGDPPPRMLDPKEPLPPRLLADWWNGPRFSVNNWLALAIQGHLRGCHTLVQQIFKRGLARDRWMGGPAAVNLGHGWFDPKANRSMVEPPAGGGPAESLAATAWNHWMNMAVQPGADRTPIPGRMEKLIAGHPFLAGPPQLAFLKSLKLTVQPGDSKPGSVEALIDGLTEYTARDGDISVGFSGDSNYGRLLLLGFDAVPALISHLDDQRLTRDIIPRFNNFPPLPLHVGEVVAGLIRDLGGPDAGDDTRPLQTGNPSDTASVRQWWEKANATGELAYVCAHVIPTQKGDNDGVNMACLRIIAARYPAHLGETYGRLLKDRPDIDSCYVAEIIAKSETLGRDEKLALFHKGAEQPMLAHRENALSELLKLDPQFAEARLIAELDKLPADVDQAYWECPEADISNLVMESRSPAVWEAFMRAARRASVGLRMEMMNPLDYAYIGDAQRKERLAFLAGFLDDKTVRIFDDNKPGRFDGPCAGFTFPRISVRDFAAMKIGGILDLPGNPGNDWTPGQWERYRAIVRAALPGR